MRFLVGKLIELLAMFVCGNGDVRGFGSIEKFIVVVCIDTFAVYTMDVSYDFKVHRGK